MLKLLYWHLFGSFLEEEVAEVEKQHQQQEKEAEEKEETPSAPHPVYGSAVDVKSVAQIA